VISKSHPQFSFDSYTTYQMHHPPSSKYRMEGHMESAMYRAPVLISDSWNQ